MNGISEFKIESTQLKDCLSSQLLFNFRLLIQVNERMKVIVALVILLTLLSCKQQDQSNDLPVKPTLLLDPVPNSYQEMYSQTMPDLIYSYNDSTQTHNYSGNWDLDGDHINDSVLFVGEGGAHLFFHLCIKTSKQKEYSCFEYLSTDMPLMVLTDSATIFQPDDDFPKFVAKDFNADGRIDLYLNIGDMYSGIPKELSSQGIRSKQVIVSIPKDKLIVSAFPDHLHHP